MSQSAPLLSVAPMIEWTDRHYRFMARLFSKRALLYTEMIAAAAVLRGPRARLLDFSPEERPLALQLGGSEPDELAEAVRIAADWGYDEINLNVGCPSDKVQSGCFGAVLMRDPDRVARVSAAMIAAAPTGVEITVKCRIGVDDDDPEARLPEFVDRVASAGVRRFAIHARKAWLSGLSPKENRSIPPLDYPLVRRVKAERPDLAIVLNGGVGSLAAARAEIAAGVDGVMIGRAAYQDPEAVLGAADSEIFGAATRVTTSDAVVEAMTPYIEARLSDGVRLNAITRHMLNLFAGRPGARAWRRILSSDSVRPDAGLEVVSRALAEIGPRTDAHAHRPAIIGEALG